MSNLIASSPFVVAETILWIELLNIPLFTQALQVQILLFVGVVNVLDKYADALAAFKSGKGRKTIVLPNG